MASTEKRLADMSDAELRDIDFKASAIKSLQCADRDQHNKQAQELWYASAQVFATLALVQATNEAENAANYNAIKVWQALEDLVARP